MRTQEVAVMADWNSLAARAVWCELVRWMDCRENMRIAARRVSASASVTTPNLATQVAVMGTELRENGVAPNGLLSDYGTEVKLAVGNRGC
jgi:hypothetical protein